NTRMHSACATMDVSERGEYDIPPSAYEAVTKGDAYLRHLLINSRVNEQPLIDQWRHRRREQARQLTAIVRHRVNASVYPFANGTKLPRIIAPEMNHDKVGPLHVRLFFHLTKHSCLLGGVIPSNS